MSQLSSKKPQRWNFIPLTKSFSATSTETATQMRNLASSTSSGRSSPIPEPGHSKSINELDEEANDLIRSAYSREDSRPTTPTPLKISSRTNSLSLGGASFSRISLSIMPSFTGLSRTRSNTAEDGRGRKKKGKSEDSASRDSSAPPSRSMSPFRRRSKTRDRSPSVEALRKSQSDAESDADSVMTAPRNAFSEKDSDSEDEMEEWSDGFDKETEGNTERNAIIAPLDEAELLDLGPDPLGEGVNIIRAPEPLFPQQPAPTRRKRPVKSDALPLVASAPLFQRDRCTVTLTHGKPSIHRVERPGRRYLVASDLSEESKYAVEWGIGTVLKDGDEMLIVTVSETDVKLDSLPHPDRLAKLRNQQERQALSYLLVKQATALLQRTKLHVTVKCQAIHAKHARHILLDITDFYQPIMIVVGSRGVGKLKGILLGSTSHYLIQKSSVPVMVARRRLRRAVRHSQIPPRTKHVPLAQATIEKVGQGGAEKNVQAMRDEIEKEEASRQHQKVGIAAGMTPMSPISPAMGADVRNVEDSSSDDENEDQEGVKVAGDG